MTDLPRAFKGLWIPREIWLSTKLNLTQKVVWAEIDSLDNPPLGCTARNQHFMDLLGMSERTIREAISQLATRGLITVDNPDSAKRVMRSQLKLVVSKRLPGSNPANIAPLPSNPADFSESSINEKTERKQTDETRHPANITDWRGAGSANAPQPAPSDDWDPMPELRRHAGEAPAHYAARLKLQKQLWFSLDRGRYCPSCGADQYSLLSIVESPEDLHCRPCGTWWAGPNKGQSAKEKVTIGVAGQSRIIGGGDDGKANQAVGQGDGNGADQPPNDSVGQDDGASAPDAVGNRGNETAPPQGVAGDAPGAHSQSGPIY